MKDVTHETATGFLLGLCEEIEKEDEKQDFGRTGEVDLNGLSPRSLFSRLRKGVCELVNFKQMICEADLYEVVSEVEKLESCIQLREADVRKHIQKQYQLRVTLQERKWDLEKLENQEQGKNCGNKVETKADWERNSKFSEENKGKQDLAKKLEELSRSIEAKDAKIQIVTKENEELKQKFEERVVEFAILKKEKKRIENLAHLMKRSPSSVNADEMQPGPECTIFLSPLLEKSERRKSQLQPRHKRASTTLELDFHKPTDSVFSPNPVVLKQEVTKQSSNTYKRSLFHDRTYTKSKTNTE